MKYENQIIRGDALEVLKTLDSESIDLVVSSPPYNVGIKMELIELAAWFLAMMLSAEIARKKNKNVVYAILLSFLFGYGALVYYMVCARNPDQWR